MGAEEARFRRGVDFSSFNEPSKSYPSARFMLGDTL